MWACTQGEPGTLYAAQASWPHRSRHAAQRRDHAPDAGEGHLRRAYLYYLCVLREHGESQEQRARETALLDYKIAEFKKQVAAGVPFAVGSDVGPFPHGTQAHELTLMVRYGMNPLAVLQAEMINGAKLLRWDGQIGELKPGITPTSLPYPATPSTTSRW